MKGSFIAFLLSSSVVMRSNSFFIQLIAFWGAIINVATAQTNVSGGIYSNTTWAASNSPYIVVDTVVVFPGVTLTIEPGVTVKFETDKRLEIRQAKLIAIGTSADSITFTSNSGLPSPGIWDAIFLNGENSNIKAYFCNFLFATNGIYSFDNYADTLIIKRSSFRFNETGFNNEFGGVALIDSCSFKNNLEYGLYIEGSYVNYCNISKNQNGIYGHSNIITNTRVDSSFNIGIEPAIGASVGTVIDNCEIIDNTYGIVSMGGEMPLGRIINSQIDSNIVAGIVVYAYLKGDTVFNCQISNNGIGILDTTCLGCNGGTDVIMNNFIENNNIGIKHSTAYDTIFCNKICNNNIYNFWNNSILNVNISNNYWCTSDSSAVASKMYDGYDNINLGLVSFMPIDTLQCYLTVGIKEDNNLRNVSAVIFPNPGSEEINILLSTFVSHGKIEIINLIGEIKYSSTFTGREVLINISDLPIGLYIVEINTANSISKQKLIKQ